LIPAAVSLKKKTEHLFRKVQISQSNLDKRENSNMKTLLKITFYTILIVFLLPATGFAIRGAFPFNKPEFKGLTYYQLSEWRWWDYQRLDREQRVYRPDAIDWNCFALEYGIKVPIIPVQSFTFAVAGLNGAKPVPLHSIPENVTYANFPSKWWEAAESLLWFNLDVVGRTPNKACYSGRNIPSAEEFEETVDALKARVTELDEILVARGEQASK
jgi:hypothetical protein